MQPKDPTPFGTRTKLLTNYAQEVRAISEGKDPFPVAIEVNVANFCNQGCHWCINENIRNGSSVLDLAHPGVGRFFSDFRAKGGRALVWSGGGEPSHHPKFADALRMVAAAGIEQGLITHGAFPGNLVEPITKHCKWVRISIDTHDRNAYSKQREARPTSFDLVIKNAAALAENGLTVGLNMNVATWNKEHIEDLFELACKLKVSYLQVRPTLPTPFPHVKADELLSSHSVPEILKRCQRLLQQRENGKTRLVLSSDKFEDIGKPDYGRDYVGCRAHRIFVVLNWNGDLKVCMYHLTDERFTLGNIYTQTLEEIWRSETRKSVVRLCEKNLKHDLHGCQICCKGHEINKVLLGMVQAPLNPLKTEPLTSPFL